MARQEVTQQMTADPPAPRARRHRQIQNLPFPAGHLPDHDEPHYRAPLFGDLALISEIIARIPVGCFRRGGLDIGNGWKHPTGILAIISLMSAKSPKRGARRSEEH